MNERIKELTARAKALFLGVNKRIRMIVGVVLAVAVLFIAGFFLFSKLSPYTVLFTDLSAEDTQNIIAYLDENGISTYRVEDGDTITVPSNIETSLRAKLMMENYPHSGFAYETYRSFVGQMATESDRTNALLHDLQDRMAGVIRCLNGVKDAVVTIVPEEDSRYILDTSRVTKASASVLVTMDGGSALSDQQANAIKTLVSRAVKGLSIDNVGVSDSNGNVYNVGGSSAATGEDSLVKLRMENEVSNKVRTQVMLILAPLFGEENVRVGVFASVDLSHMVGESTKYTEPEWAADGSTGGKGIIGSRVYDNTVVQDPEEGTGGVVGTETNSDIPTYVENNLQVDGDEPYIHSAGEDQYNVNTDKVQTERWAGVVEDVMVSVTINADAAKGVNQTNLLGHIARMAGIPPDIQGDKISIFVAPFFAPAEIGIIGGGLPFGIELPFPIWVLYAAAGGVALLLIILIMLAMRKRKKSKRRKRQLDSLVGERQGAVMAQAAAGADIMNIKTERSMELRKDIRQFTEDNPEIAAHMIKTWLKGGDDRDG